jgi:hypothetical protein
MGVRTTKGLASEDICLIIESCSNHGVSTLKFGDFELSFGPKAQALPPGEDGNIDSSIPPVTEITDDQRTKLAKDALEQDELDLRERQFAELTITDPLAAERMLIDEEVENDSNGGDADDEL